MFRIVIHVSSIYYCAIVEKKYIAQLSCLYTYFKLNFLYWLKFIYEFLCGWEKLALLIKKVKLFYQKQLQKLFKNIMSNKKIQKWTRNIFEWIDYLKPFLFSDTTIKIPYILKNPKLCFNKILYHPNILKNKLIFFKLFRKNFFRISHKFIVFRCTSMLTHKSFPLHFIDSMPYASSYNSFLHISRLLPRFFLLKNVAWVTKSRFKWYTQAIQIQFTACI